MSEPGGAERSPPAASVTLAGLPRRLAAIVYDSLLLLGVLIGATALALGLAVAVLGSEPVRLYNPLAGNPFFQTYLLLVCFFFYGGFWTHGGQTLGMQVWGLRIQNADGSAITLWQALLRFVVAIGSWLFCGLGFLWVLWDKDKRSWHDIYSESRVVQLPKNIHKK